MLLIIILVVNFTDKVQPQQFLYGLLCIESDTHLQAKHNHRFKLNDAALNNETKDARRGLKA